MSIVWVPRVVMNGCSPSLSTITQLNSCSATAMTTAKRNTAISGTSKMPFSVRMKSTT